MFATLEVGPGAKCYQTRERDWSRFPHDQSNIRTHEQPGGRPYRVGGPFSVYLAIQGLLTVGGSAISELNEWEAHCLPRGSSREGGMEYKISLRRGKVAIKA